MIESLPHRIIDFHAEAQRHRVKRIEWKIGEDQSVVHAEAQRHSVKRIEWKFGGDQSVVHAEAQRQGGE